MEQKKKILLVEDDGFTRFMMRGIGDTLGVEIDIVDSADDGLFRYENNPTSYGVVLMDVTSPDQAGLVASEALRSVSNGQGQNVPIIAVTAREDGQDDILIETHGMSAVLRKPITPGEVMDLVDRYC